MHLHIKDFGGILMSVNQHFRWEYDSVLPRASH